MLGLPALAEQPAYAFKVYGDGNLIWEGKLASTQDEVSLPLSPTAQDISYQPRLVFRRDKKEAAQGNSLFFGEVRVVGFVTRTAHNTSVTVPEVFEGLWRIPLRQRDDVQRFSLGALEGSYTQGKMISVEILQEPTK